MTTRIRPYPKARIASALVVNDFIRQYVHSVEESCNIPSVVLYELYELVAKLNECTPVGARIFSKAMRQHGFDKGARPIPGHYKLRGQCYLKCMISNNIRGQYEYLLNKFVDTKLDNSYVTT
jgi:hypothetical protein